MGDFKGSYLTPFPFLRAIYLTCLWISQSLDYEEKCKETGDFYFTWKIKCRECYSPLELKTVSWLSPRCHLRRFTDTWSYCRSTRTKLFRML